MREPMVIAVAQPPCVAHDVAANAGHHAAAVRAAAARVVVFPELSLTGYELDAEPLGVDDRRLTPLLEACTATESVALAGAPVADAAGGRHIAMMAFGPDGARVVYRKMHLGDDERPAFSPGVSPAVLEVCGWRLGLAICKDTGVADHAAATAALGCDAYVAGALERAEDDDVQPRRAVRVAGEHGVWVAIASFAGSTGGGYSATAGGSGIWRPDGSPATRAGREPGDVARAALR